MMRIYFWFYVFIVGLLLFNVFLAIIVNSYVELQETAIGGGPMLNFTRTMLESFNMMIDEIGVWIRRILCCHRRSHTQATLKRSKRIPRSPLRWRNC